MEFAITIIVFIILGGIIRFILYAIFESGYEKTIKSQKETIERLEDELKWERRNNDKR